MNLYKISQTINQNWDTFDSAVVIAKSADEACKIIPSFDGGVGENGDYVCWSRPENVKVELIGVVDGDYLVNMHGKVNVISSFNAG